MAIPLPVDRPEAFPQFAAALLESDAAYFEAGARVERLPGATLSWMEGLERLAAGGVVHRVESGLGGLPPSEWLDVAESAVHRVGRSSLRLYLTRPHPDLEAALRSRGYRPRTELGFLYPGPYSSSPTERHEVVLRPVRTEADWRVKSAVHAAGESGPDGHPAAARDWIAMERRKVEAGYLRPHLAWIGDDVCGTIGTSRQETLHRLKNLVLHPAWRHQGIGAKLIHALLDELGVSGFEAAGCFAVDQSEGAALYRRCGFEAVTLQTEWTRSDEPWRI